MMTRAPRQVAGAAAASLLLSVPLAGALAPTAAAALALKYDPPKAPPGTAVSVETVGGSGGAFREAARRLFLAPAGIADKIRTLTDSRISPIGELSFDDEEVGRLTFTVPDLGAGRYIAVVAAGSDGRPAITAPEPFQVTAVGPEAAGPAPSGRGDDGMPTGVLIALVGVGILAAAVVGAWGIRGRRRRASLGH
jgi:hypothetical protein